MPRLIQYLGPGLLLAGAAIGVSHLVQATRAGAEFRFALIWLLIVACLSKYPFLEIGPRYVAATGEDLIQGYRRLGLWAVWVCLVVTLGSMFIIQAAVTFVTGAIAVHVFGVGTPVLWCGIALTLCMLMLAIGRYPLLDVSMKVIMAVLLAATLAAVIIALWHSGIPAVREHATPIWTVGGFAFLLAFMGWMPIPIDSAIWHSIWIRENERRTGSRTNLRSALIDFNTGYLLAGLVAIAFLLLGATVMYGDGTAFSTAGGAFVGQLVEMYTQTLGEWSRPLIAIAALTTMFSTTLVVLDAFPRVMQRLLGTLLTRSVFASKPGPVYVVHVVLLAGVAMLIISAFAQNLIRLIDLATTLSFLTAPILAMINYLVITGKNVPASARPGPWLRVLCWASIVFLTLFSLAYIDMQWGGLLAGVIFGASS